MVGFLKDVIQVNVESCVRGDGIFRIGHYTLLVSWRYLGKLFAFIRQSIHGVNSLCVICLFGCYFLCPSGQGEENNGSLSGTGRPW